MPLENKHFPGRIAEDVAKYWSALSAALSENRMCGLAEGKVK